MTYQVQYKLMTNEELKTKITELLTGASFEEGGEFVTVNVEAAAWKAFAKHLFYDESLQFDFLTFCTAVDWSQTPAGKTHFTMVYHLDSARYHHNLVVKIKLPADKPEVETICDIWPTANFHERETYEFFGIKFLNHPDLRLLILPDGWEGKNPLRKGFEDPVNMIKL